MPSFIEEEKTIEVPKGIGVDGLLKAVAKVLELSRVQNITIDVTGKVSYKRFRKEDEPEQVTGLDFSSVMPWQIVRGHAIEEVPTNSTNAAVVLGQLFARVSMDGFNPVSFVASPSTKFWTWYTATTSLHTGHVELHGLPFLVDPQVPEEALVMCVAYGRRAGMVDVVKSYKITVPMRKVNVAKKDQPE